MKETFGGYEKVEASKITKFEGAVLVANVLFFVSSIFGSVISAQNYAVFDLNIVVLICFIVYLVFSYIFYKMLQSKWKSTNTKEVRWLMGSFSSIVVINFIFAYFSYTYVQFQHYSLTTSISASLITSEIVFFRKRR